MKSYSPFCSKVHRGIVLDVASEGFDKGSANSGSIFIDQDDPNTRFLFYSGYLDTQFRRAAIGLAVSKDGFEFQKINENPILDGNSLTFNDGQVLTPATTRVGNRFYMVFSGRHSANKSRRIGIACAQDPKGPWNILGEILKPTSVWEGPHLDNGPTLAKLDDTTFLVFYSSIMTHSRFDILAYLRGYSVRKIGLAKVRILGPSLSQIEVHKHSANPLRHLNGEKGSWNESMFCPGYFKLTEINYMVPAASTYSIGYPYKQYIGIASSNTLNFKGSQTHVEKLIDGPSEKEKIIPDIKSQICLDSPSPLLVEDEHKLFLYYSVADRSDYIWRTALTVFDYK